MASDNTDNYSRIDPRYKKMALERIVRESLFTDPTLTDEISKIKILKSSENVKLKETVLNSIANAFDSNFVDFVDVVDGIMTYTEGEYLILSSIDTKVDEFNQEWVSVFYFMPSGTDESILTEALDALANTLNNKANFGLWANIKTKEMENSLFGYLSGFTIKKTNWTFATASYAAYGIQQLHAYGSRMFEDEKFSSKTLTKILSDNLGYLNDNPPSINELVREGINIYINKLTPRLQEVFAPVENEKGFYFTVPLKQGGSNDCTVLYLVPYTNPILGAGLYFNSMLPGVVPKNQALKLSQRLNIVVIDEDHDLTYQTTPKISGAWCTEPSGISDEFYIIKYSGFIPFAVPENFTVSEQIEGIVREIYASWPTFNEQITFNKITNSELLS